MSIHIRHVVSRTSRLPTVVDSDTSTEAFASDLLDVISNHFFLDDYFREHGVKKSARMPHFTASYLVACVRSRRNDLPSIKLIRAIAQRLADTPDIPAPSGQSRDDLQRGYIEQLCQCVVEHGNVAYFFTPRSKKRGNTTKATDHDLLIAAAYLNHPSLVRRLIDPRRNYTKSTPATLLLGSATAHVLRHKDVELLSAFPRAKHLDLGVWAGHLACTLHLYTSSMPLPPGSSKPSHPPLATGTALPATFTTTLDASPFLLNYWSQNLLDKWLLTPSPDIFTFVLALRENTEYWNQAVGRKLVEMLLECGADTKGAVGRAAMGGHGALVGGLLDRGVRVTRNAVGKVVAKGDLGMARVLGRWLGRRRGRLVWIVLRGRSWSLW